MELFVCSMPHPADVLEHLQLLNEYSTCTGVANGTSFSIGSSMAITTGTAVCVTCFLVVFGALLLSMPCV